MYWHWQNLTKDERKGEWPWHGRAWFRLSDDSNESVHVEWNLRSTSCGISASVSPGGDELLHFGVQLPPIALYVGVQPKRKGLVSKLAHWIARKSCDMGSKYSGTELSLQVHNWAVWWNVFADDSGWTHTRPKWRDGNWHPLGHNKRQSEEVVEERAVLVPMPERAYRGHAKLTRGRWGFTNLPRMFDKTILRVSIDMDKGEQIPEPGKGENSYDCGDDATFGLSCMANTIEDGIGQLVASVMSTRRRRGGPEVWDKKPEPEPSPQEGGGAVIVSTAT